MIFTPFLVPRPTEWGSLALGVESSSIKIHAGKCIGWGPTRKRDGHQVVLQQHRKPVPEKKSQESLVPLSPLYVQSKKEVLQFDPFTQLGPLIHNGPTLAMIIWLKVNHI